uniref:START domain-containing protein n=1 Tax=Panagrolaimus sp. JU765 TaxID=591449 RepID=A0AC34QHU4_9BILA
MEVNVVKVFDDKDFEYVKQLCDDHDEWTVVYHKKTNRVWTKPAPNSDFHMIKARSTYHDICAETVYDVLHDPHYRRHWDKYMITSKDIGIINPNNDICYYSLGAYPPIQSRDFVMQRSWLDTGHEKYICGHSVCHDDFPPIKGYVRGTIYLTAYFVRTLDEKSCEITYVTHSDPKGRLPVWLINKMTKVVAPKALKKLHKACSNYPLWKSKHQPQWKPWIFPHQLQNAVRVDLKQCQSKNYDQVILDESNISANEMQNKESDNEKD